MSTLNPARDATSPSVAVTVVFPTPPLPATMTTWEVEQNSATSIASHARRKALPVPALAAPAEHCEVADVHLEPVLLAYVCAYVVEQRRRRVDDRTALLAHEVLV